MNNHQVAKKFAHPCKGCGKEIVGTAGKLFCSECLHNRRVVQKRSYNAQERARNSHVFQSVVGMSREEYMGLTHDIGEAMKTVTNERLRNYIHDYRRYHPHQKIVKPDWCSSPRWRIFIRFMQSPKFYSIHGELPHRRCPSRNASVYRGELEA